MIEEGDGGDDGGGVSCSVGMVGSPDTVAGLVVGKGQDSRRSTARLDRRDRRAMEYTGSSHR